VKLGRQHVIASLVLLVASILYNVWVFTRPASGRTPADEPPTAVPQDAGSIGASRGAADPTQVRQLPDVALDRAPVWTRNPFEHSRLKPVAVEPPAPAPVAEVPLADPHISSILHSPDRRLALIEGRIVRVGDMVAGAKVVDILPNAVVVESPERGRRALGLRQPGTTARVP